MVLTIRHRAIIFLTLFATGLALWLLTVIWWQEGDWSIGADIAFAFLVCPLVLLTANYLIRRADAWVRKGSLTQRS